MGSPSFRFAVVCGLVALTACSDSASTDQDPQPGNTGGTAGTGGASGGAGVGGDGGDATCVAASLDGTASLASTMAENSGMRELDLTVSAAAIGFGDGSFGDADGLYLATDPTMLLGSMVDLFPREADFVVGAVSYGTEGLTGCGTEIAPITGLDLSELWSLGEERDISHSGIADWLFGAEYAFVFGPVADDDTVTFEDGVLASIDLTITVAFEIDYSLIGNRTTYDNGMLTVRGDAISLQLDDTQVDLPTAFGVEPRSQLVIDFRGTVNAVFR